MARREGQGAQEAYETIQIRREEARVLKPDGLLYLLGNAQADFKAGRNDTLQALVPRAVHLGMVQPEAGLQCAGAFWRA